MSNMKEKDLLLPLIASSFIPPHQPKFSQSVDDVDGQDGRATFCEHILALLLHILLAADFGMFFYQNDPLVKDLDWKLVIFSVVLYWITAHLYRACLSGIGVSSDFTLLLPEIIIVTSMCIAFFQNMIAAFLLLILAKLIMALCVIAISVQRLCKTSSSDEEETRHYDTVQIV